MRTTRPAGTVWTLRSPAAPNSGAGSNPDRRFQAAARADLLQAQAREYPLARLTALPIADIQEPGDAPQQACLVIVQLAIGVGDFPQHLDQFDPLGVIETVLDRAGEAVPLN